MIYFKEEKTTLKELTITNSTFNTFDNTFIQTAGSAGDVVITINACTFYNVIGGGKYLIDANGAGDINISNTIFAKTYSDTAKGIRQSGTGEIKISQVYFTSDFKLSSNAFSPDLTNTPVPSEEIFEDAENGDFTITDKELSVLGDPRWFPTEE